MITSSSTKRIIQLAQKASSSAFLRAIGASARKSKIARHAQGVCVAGQKCGNFCSKFALPRHLENNLGSACVLSHLSSAQDSFIVPNSTMIAAAIAATVAVWGTAAVTFSEGAFEAQEKGSMMHQAKPGIKELGIALAKLHERQKVQLGRLLHDFYQLLEEAEELEAPSESQEDLEVNEKKAQQKAKDSQSTADSSFVDIPVDSLVNLTPQAAWEMIEKLHEGKVFSQNDLKRVVHAATEVLEQEPTVNDLRNRTDLSKVTVVGDIHGDINSLFDVLGLFSDQISEGENEAYLEAEGSPWNGTGAIVFNGDFVDRGENSLGVLLVLMLLKIVFPKHVFLNRGNHEDALLATVYGFSEELQERYGVRNVDDVWEAISKFFSALPLCVRTDTAAIMHGGIPSDGFKISELESITLDQRSKIKSLLEPEDDALCQLVQNLLWSDPKPEDGIQPNEDRGAGVFFGPDITHRFLTDHGLEYLIRSHEVVDEGYDDMESRNGHSAITVFSSARYPNGEGYNFGAVIQISSEGIFTPICFDGQHHLDNNFEEEYFNRTLSKLVQVIAENEFELLSAFKEKAGTRKFITRQEWADVMSQKMNLDDVDWLAIQPLLAPTVADGPGSEIPDLIDYQKFLDLNCNVLSSSIDQLDDETMETLRRNHAILITVFKFLDTNGNGLIDRDEFRWGIGLLNKRFPNEHRFDDPDAIFDAIDIDGSGEIDLDEFEKAFQSVEMPYSEAVFKLFDKDRNGMIDREEFREALNFINSRLPASQKFSLGESDRLFDKLDIDKSGVLELDEFKYLLADVIPE